MTRVLVTYSPHRLGRSKNGEVALENNILSTVQEVEEALCSRGYKTERASLQRDLSFFSSRVNKFKPDVIFNLCEHVDGNASMEKNAVAVFELMRLRFTGNGSLPLALCLEKAFAKRLLRAHKIPTPDFVVVPPGESDVDFALPAIVKPAFADGSLGITARSVVKTKQALKARIQYVHRQFKQPALVEEFINGREFQLSLIGNGSPKFLAISELSYAGLPNNVPRICSYSAKWRPSTAYYRHTTPLLPAPISKKLWRRLEQIAENVYYIFGLRGYARLDFRLADGDKPQLIEINPNPDISRDAGMVRAAKYAQLSYEDLIVEVTKLGLEHPL